MSNDSQKEFLSKAKNEIKQRVDTENNALNTLKKEKDELINAIVGYTDYYDTLNKFIIESMQDFTCNEDDLPGYFKSNINEVYQNHVQIRKDALLEVDTLNKYIAHCDKEIKSNQRTLKFYRSQYLDSDFFDECLPLVNLYQEKIDIYNENKENTSKVIEILEKIAKKLEKWV